MRTYLKTLILLCSLGLFGVDQVFATSTDVNSNSPEFHLSEIEEKFLTRSLSEEEINKVQSIIRSARRQKKRLQHQNDKLKKRVSSSQADLDRTRLILKPLEKKFAHLVNENQDILDVATSTYKHNRSRLYNSSLHIYNKEQLERLLILDRLKDQDDVFRSIHIFSEALLAEMWHERQARNSFYYTHPLTTTPEEHKPPRKTLAILDATGKTYQSEVVTMGNLLSFTNNRFLDYDPEEKIFRVRDPHPNNRSVRMIAEVPEAAARKLVTIPVKFNADDLKPVGKLGKSGNLLIDTTEKLSAYLAYVKEHLILSFTIFIMLIFTIRRLFRNKK